ncbi:alpha-amylase family glycosyl hydrolase [Pseudarthrobacter oxydans]|uniref:alpha-amylase family glycosyl hydrolase n=1 Tax=Pseudarthrobacter oxydans TaxID=1671 RepID=UPI003F50C22A
MGRKAVARAFADIRAALAVLNAEVDGCGSEPFSAADPLAGLADGSLDILAGAREAEAGLAGLKARAAMRYAGTAHTLAPLGAPVPAQEMAVAAEIGCVLALGPRAASTFLSVSHALTTTLPLTLAALHAGTISWQHALVMVDEAATLDPAGVVALEAHFLDPAVPKPPTAAAIGEMPAHRLRHKARTWRERHHVESIEKRHAKGVAERRVEYRPDKLVFASETHGYDTTDYFRIDPRLGDDADFDELIAQCHARGLKVLLDGVFNHVGRSFGRSRMCSRTVQGLLPPHGSACSGRTPDGRRGPNRTTRTSRATIIWWPSTTTNRGRRPGHGRDEALAGPRRRLAARRGVRRAAGVLGPGAG